MVKWVKRLKWLAPLLAGLGLIFGGLILFGVVCGEKAPDVIQKGLKKAPKEKTTGAPLSWLPGRKKTKADILLEDWPRGTRIVEVGPSEETTYVTIPPTGDILIPPETTNVTVYEKPKSNVGFEFRPFIGAAYGNTGLGAVAGVDVFKIWKVHTGLGITANQDAVAGVGAVGVSIWRNVDLKGYGGATLSGEKVFGGAVTIAIE